MIVLFHTHIEPESTQVQTKLPINDTNTIYYNDSKILIIKSAGWLEIINNEEALVQNFVPDSSIHQNPKEWKRKSVSAKPNSQKTLTDSNHHQKWKG